MTVAIVPKKLLLCMVILALSACSSAPRKPQPVPLESTAEFTEVPLQQRDRTANQWLAVAQTLQGAEQVDALLQAAATLQRDADWQKSAVVVAQIQRHFEVDTLAVPQQQLLALLEARFAAHDARWPYVEQLLQPLLTPRLTDAFPQQTLELALQAARAQQHWQQAAHYQLQLVNLMPTTDNAEAAAELWSTLKYVSKPSDVVLPPASQRTQEVAGWAALMRTLHAINRQPEALESLANTWQQGFSGHPGQFVIDQLQALTATARSNVVVLLPLSGQYQAQGTAVRDGMVMALARLPQVNATFIDTNQLDFNKLPELLQQHQANLLVGPLLKPNVAAIDATVLPPELPWLTLNEQEPSLDSPHGLQHFFALDSETEIRQAAAHMAARGHRHPVVFAPDTLRGKQQAEVFAQAWQQQFADDMPLEIGTYRTTDEMKSAVQEQLGVSQSDARIYQVKIAAGKIIVDAEARSRADLDSVYLVGGIEQTRLLKPFIDVNISAFRKALPVYANSGSHTLRNSLSENDLDNVRFTEAPWLLPNHSQQQLLEDLLKLRSAWGYNDARLAAFGHDAIVLSQRLPLLQLMPGISAQGLTGELHIEAQQIIRQLNWARFEGHQVVAR
ncbi:MAG: penicillin-binding protein activator [Gammaproteobacteria bacterium]|nr:penicillin-binding protein activator [Gammaproteobacteria bacterium]